MFNVLAFQLAHAVTIDLTYVTFPAAHPLISTLALGKLVVYIASKAFVNPLNSAFSSMEPV